MRGQRRTYGKTNKLLLALRLFIYLVFQFFLCRIAQNYTLLILLNNKRFARFN